MKSRRQRNRLRRARNAKKRVLGASGWRRERLSQRLDRSMALEQAERERAAAVAREEEERRINARHVAFEERQAGINAAVFAAAAREQARAEQEARRNHERTVRDADTPMTSEPVWHSHERSAGR